MAQYHGPASWPMMDGICSVPLICSTPAFDFSGSYCVVSDWPLSIFPSIRTAVGSLMLVAHARTLA